MLQNDNLARVLAINLTTKTFSVTARQDLFDAYLGGAGVAAALLEETCPRGCDPLSPDNPIIFAIGPLTGLYPLASKTVAMFKSPLTGNLGESHCGGRSAVAMRMAGYGAIIIQGASAIPLYISIDGSTVRFHDASSLWGMGNFSVGRIIREREKGAGFRTIMRIGRGGEHLVRYASVTTETYRHFGRLGLGAVFGSKHLKAVVITGRSSIPVSDVSLYKKTYTQIYKNAVSSPVMQKYHDLGTAENVSPLNAYGGLPIRNLQSAKDDNFSALSGEELARNYLGRRLACTHCPVGCIHIAALREPYEDEAYFYRTSMISYDYEPIYALGTMLGITEPMGYLKLMDKVEAIGIDAMSTGVVLAWATEALEKRLIGEGETLGINLSWGGWQAYIQAAQNIVEQPNEFYRNLAKGVEHASSLYGGRDFALSFGKNEMPGYHTGPAAHLGVLIGARHSHLDNAGYSIDQKTLLKEAMGPKDLVDALLKEEWWRQILSSLVLCFFARGVYLPETVEKILPVAGFSLDEKQLMELGRRIHAAKYRFKLREGFSFEELRIPRRILETPTPIKAFTEPYLREALLYAKKMVSGEIDETAALRNRKRNGNGSGTAT
ncbi:MAG: aldehyde:ferredoxin oxidoreductase [Deltaproteobacteria bacterium]|nr:aldehyde:ferredoxin oxidoreductase [Deltaproteobacteria bacterium]